MTVSGGGTAMHFNPAAAFAPGATVQVFMTADAEDLAGNALFDYTGSFTVLPDTTALAPTLVRSSPSFASTGNPLNAVIDVEFSEPLARIDGHVRELLRPGRGEPARRGHAVAP